MSALLVRFNHQTSPTEATRARLKDLADRLGVSETRAVHIAINRLHRDLVDGRQDFDFPTAAQIKAEEDGQDRRVTRVKTI